jgi:hypothetical protein
MKARILLPLAIAELIIVLTISSCDQIKLVKPPSKDLYFLVDTSQSYAQYSERSLTRLQSILYAMRPGDRITVAKIQSCSYSDESVLLPARTLSTQESTANRDKIQLGAELKALEGTLVPTPYTDIRGALIMASQHFKRSRSQHKLLIIFSDLRDDPEPGCATQAEELIEVTGVIVVLADVSISKPDEANAAGRVDRINGWRELFIKRGAKSVELVSGVYEIETIINELNSEPLRTHDDQ